MRHVLLTLSLHMNADGSSCYPSIRRLAVESGLHMGTVSKHLQLAQEDGWLERTLRGMSGQGWRRLEYRPAFPEGVRTEHTPSENVSAENEHLSSEGVRTERKKVFAQNELSSTTTSSNKDMSELDADAREVLGLCDRLRLDRRSRKGLSGRPLKATPKRLSKIKARRRDGFSHAELLDVPRAFYADSWEGRDRYDDPIYAFKDDATVQGWLDKRRNGAGDGELADLQLVAGGAP